MALQNNSVFGNQQEIMNSIDAANPMNNMLTARVGDVDIPLGITYGTAITLVLGTVAGQVLADVLPAAVKKLLGTTNDEVIQTLSEAVENGAETASKTEVTLSPFRRG